MSRVISRGCSLSPVAISAGGPNTCRHLAPVGFRLCGIPPHTWALAPLHAGPGWGRVVPADRSAEGPLAGGDGGQGLTGRTRAGGGSAACLAITLRLQLFIERLGKVSF